METPYTYLASAVIKNACRDYKNALKNLQKNPDSLASMRTKRECESFFTSAWFRSLTSTLDGRWLMSAIQKEEATIGRS